MGQQSFEPICLKTLRSLSPPPVMLHIKFYQDWLTGLRDIQVRMCKIFVIQGQVTPKWVVWSGPKSNSSELLCRPVKFLEKKIVTTRAMTTFSEQGARTARTRRKTESGNTSLLLTSLVKWSAKLIGTLCSARIINVSAIVIPWPVFECNSTLKSLGPETSQGQNDLVAKCPFTTFVSIRLCLTLIIVP